MKKDNTYPKGKPADAASLAEDKNVLNRGNSINGLNEADIEEFATRKKNSKKTAEAQKEEAEREEENRNVRKANRISDSGVRDDDDDGTDAMLEEEEVV